MSDVGSSDLVQHDLGELRGNAALDDQAGRASQRVAAGGILACVGVAALADRENAGRAQRDGRCRIGVDQYLGGASRSVATILRLEETGVSAASARGIAEALRCRQGRSRARRSDERRVGEACVSTGRSRWAPDNKKKKHQKPQ